MVNRPLCTAVIVLVMLTVLDREGLCGQITLDSCIDRLEQTYERMQDLQARFRQETAFGALERAEKGRGRVYLKKGGKMLWEYREPAVQKIILDGKTLWIYLPEEKQVMKNSAASIPSGILGDLFTGDIDIRQKFKSSFRKPAAGGDQSTLVLELLPRQYDPALKRLVLWIDVATFYITRSLIEDDMGNTTTLQFDDITADKGLDDCLFHFVPPPGVDVFEPPRL